MVQLPKLPIVLYLHDLFLHGNGSCLPEATIIHPKEERNKTGICTNIFAKR
jgi:hypothetical protein